MQYFVEKAKYGILEKRSFKVLKIPFVSSKRMIPILASHKLHFSKFYWNPLNHLTGNRRGGLVIRASPNEWEVVGSIPGHNKPKSLKLLVVAFPLRAQDYGNSTTSGPPVSGYWTG